MKKKRFNSKQFWGKTFTGNTKCFYKENCTFSV